MRAASPAIALLLCTAVLSCGPAPAWIDGEALMFDPDWIVEVNIQLDEDDWDELRRQVRSFEDVLCATAPPKNPFTYFKGDITVDGIKVKNVGIRKKCFFGSCDDVRPSFKISFNQYVRGQRFFGLRRMTLNNSRSDPSKVKQCMGYWLFARGGVPAPRCNFAHVTVNGVDKGLYVNLESIKTEMLTRYFDDTRGNLYEGALSDFHPEWMATFQKKTNEINPDRSDLDKMVNVCAIPDDDQFVEELENHIDLDAFYDFWVMEVLIAHWDGYASFNRNNYYIYNNPDTGRFHFFPWGIDGILFSNPAPETINSVFADGIIPHRLYKIPRMQDRYINLLREKLATVWAEDVILSEIDRMEALITPYVHPNDTPDLSWKIEEVRNFVRNNPVDIKAEIDPEPLEWTKELSSPPCWRIRGSLNATFSTTWGSVNSPDPWGAGTGTFDAVLDELPIPTSFVSSVAGIDPNPEGQKKPLVQVLAQVPDPAGDKLIAALVQINDPEMITAGGSVPLNMGVGFGMIFKQIDADNFEIFLLMDGELTFQDAAMTDGAPVIGTIEANIRESGW
jgi:hypothetical protein